MADLPVDNEDLSLKIIKVVHSKHFRHCNQGFCQIYKDFSAAFDLKDKFSGA